MANFVAFLLGEGRAEWYGMMGGEGSLGTGRERGLGEIWSIEKYGGARNGNARKIAPKCNIHFQKAPFTSNICIADSMHLS